MSILDRTEYIAKFGGNIWYINKGTGSDTNSGKRPDVAFETIGAGITAMGDGDALNIKAGTYVEASLDLDNAAAEMWCEIGTLIDTPGGATALIVSGANCKVSGNLKITPDDGEKGILISGAECWVSDVKVLQGSHNFSITGAGVILDRCAAGFPADGTSGYNITGAQARLRGCSTVGDTTTYGYKINGGADTGVLDGCTSAGHQTSGYYIDTGSINWTLLNCSSGGGDGRWVDVDHANVWSGFTYDSELAKVITFSGAPTEYNIFKLTGAVRISEIFGTVETVIPDTASTAYLQLYSAGGTVNITALGTQLQNVNAGSILVRNGPSTDVLDLAEPDATPAVAENTNWKDPKTAIDIVEDDSNATYVRVVLSAALASGAIDWHCHWEPLSDNGILAPV